MHLATSSMTGEAVALACAFLAMTIVMFFCMCGIVAPYASANIMVAFLRRNPPLRGDDEASRYANRPLPSMSGFMLVVFSIPFWAVLVPRWSGVFGTSITHVLLGTACLYLAALLGAVAFSVGVPRSARFRAMMSAEDATESPAFFPTRLPALTRGARVVVAVCICLGTVCVAAAVVLLVGGG